MHLPLLISERFLAALVGAIALILWVFGEFYAFRRFWKQKILATIFRNRLGKGIYSQIMLLFIAASVVYFSEIRNLPYDELIHSKFYPYMRAVTSFVMPATVVLGWEAGSPESFYGQAWATFFNLCFIINGVTRIGGAIVEAVKNIFNRGGKVSEGPHYLICGGDIVSLDIILKQMTNPVLGKRMRPITILGMKKRIGEQIEGIKDSFKGINGIVINYIAGSIMNKEDLKRAGIENSIGIILLPSPHKSEEARHEPDAETLLCAKVINTFFESQSKRPPIVAKVNDPLYMSVLDDYVDQVICSTGRDYELAACSIFNEGLVEVYNNLMKISGDTNEIYMVEIPENWVGKKYEDVAYLFLKNTRQTETPISLMGIRRNKKLFLNPSTSRLEEVEEKDKLVVLAFECPDEIIQNLAEVEYAE